jgi:SAM-dependent methyltransferase
MTSAASRFYERSHEINRPSGPVAQTADVNTTLAEMNEARHRYHCVYQYLAANVDRDVVELGFGNPAVPIALASLCKTYQVVDIVDQRGDVDSPPNLLFTKADLNDDFPFSDEQFDDSVAMMVIEHLFDPFHSFREIARITRRGGRVLVNLPNIASIRCRAQLLMGNMPVTSCTDWYEKREWDGNHLHYFTVQDTLRVAKQSGLKIEEIFPVGNHLGWKRLWPSLLCHKSIDADGRAWRAPRSAAARYESNRRTYPSRCHAAGRIPARHAAAGTAGGLVSR